MFRSNSKKAMENVRKYIVDNFDSTGYDQYHDTDNFDEAARMIYNCFIEEKQYELNRAHCRFGSEYTVFEDWCRGLPSLLDTCYYYNRSPVTSRIDIMQTIREYAEHRRRFLMNSPVVDAVTHFKRLVRIDKIVSLYERNFITAYEAALLLDYVVYDFIKDVLNISLDGNHLKVDVSTEQIK